MKSRVQSYEFLVLVLIVACSSSLLAQSAVGNRRQLNRTSILADKTTWLDVNRIKLPLSSLGGLYNSYAYSSWDGWDIQDGDAMIFDQGLWITGKRNGSVGCLPYLWYSPYSPGPIISGRPAIQVRPQDAARYRSYEITAGDLPEWNPDIHAWPSDLGAPIDVTGRPRISGDQMVWMVYNGLDTTIPAWPPDFFRGVPSRTLLPVEVHQAVYAHFGELRDTSIWANTVFFEWSVYNRGSDPLDSVYLTLWTDPDFINAFFTFPAVDTNAQTAYCWYGLDSSYGSIGYTLLYGPIVPSPGSTAVTFGVNRPGMRNIPLSGFWAFNDDSFPDSSDYGPPYSLGTAWNVVRGLNQRGGAIIDPSTGKPTRFPYSGDPITKSGDIYPFHYTGGGGGFMMTTGPCSIAPGDSQWISIALIPSVKRDGVDAINRMRSNARYLRNLQYDSLTARKPRRTIPIDPLPAFNFPGSFELHQNYPNPFNAGTTIPFDLPEQSHVHMEVFDLLGRSVVTLADQVFERGTRGVTWFPVGATGVYIVRMRAESMESSRTWSGARTMLLLR